MRISVSVTDCSYPGAAEAIAARLGEAAAAADEAGRSPEGTPAPPAGDTPARA